MSNRESYKGSCFCGTVEFTVSGEPAGMGYCHCESRRHWSAGPVNAFTLWSPEAVQIILRGLTTLERTIKPHKVRANGAKPVGGTSSPNTQKWA